MKPPGPPPITASRNRRPSISITGFASTSLPDGDSPRTHPRDEPRILAGPQDHPQPIVQLWVRSGTNPPERPRQLRGSSSSASLSSVLHTLAVDRRDLGRGTGW